VDTTRTVEGPEEEAGLPAIPDPDEFQRVRRYEIPPETAAEGPESEEEERGGISAVAVPGGGYDVQLHAGRSMSVAETIQGRARTLLGFAPRILTGEEWIKVRLGPFETRTDAERARDRARRAGFPDAFVTAWEAGGDDR
jgi:cell division protein FtsN